MDIQRIVKKYLITGFSIICLIYIIGICVERLFSIPLGWSLIISYIFSIVTLLIYGLCWKLIAKSSPKSLTLYYMAGSTMRMLLAIPFVVGYWMYASSFEEVFRFVIVFIIFYLVMLAYDAIYFARVEKQNKKNNFR